MFFRNVPKQINKTELNLSILWHKFHNILQNIKIKVFNLDMWKYCDYKSINSPNREVL